MLKNVLAGLYMLASVSCGKTETVKIYQDVSLDLSMTICEYLDLNKDGRYEGYRLIKEGDGKREVISISIYEGIRRIRFASPPAGSVVEGEFPREILDALFNQYNYPNVDSLRFID